MDRSTSNQTQRQYELVLQSDGRLEGSHWIFRADIPRGPPPPRLPAAGPYAALGLESDASADEIREAYVKLAKKMHPDAGGSEVCERRTATAKTRAPTSRSFRISPRRVVDGHLSVAAVTPVKSQSEH
eukprot:6177269-Pleurochrysis_carterae.AAC.4